MADLGDTRDPRELIEGDPAAVEENARVLSARAGRAESAAQGLKALDTGSWTGLAASAFHDKFSYEPGKWHAAADALQAACGALADYADTLRWAHGQAAEAIRMWDQGEAATQQAHAEHEAAAAHAGSLNQPAPPFADPGKAHRQAARQLLDRARIQLAEVGDGTANTLRGKAEGAPESSDWLDDVGDFAADMGAQFVNSMASVGNALLNHPEDALGILGGAATTAAGFAGMAGGGALAATGIGSVPGVALTGVSATAIAGGATMVAMSAGDVAKHASGDNKVEPVKTSEPGTSPPPSEPRPAGVGENFASRPTNNGKGTFYQKPGSWKDSNSVRVMDKDAHPDYPNGYVVFTNGGNQPLRIDGKPGSRAETHIHRNPDGSYPLPDGWSW